jgi:hypothetical protein
VTQHQATNLANDRRTFWPRNGPAMSFVPDLGDDRPCESCGYNLRGLPFSSACPECGATWGISAADAESIAWNDDATLGNFFSTAMMVLTGGRDLATQVWTRDTLWLGLARRFRRINITVATIALTPVIVAVQAAFVGWDRALLCAPLDVLCVFWWNIWLTAQPAMFLKDKGSPTPSKRAAVLSCYLSAALLLSPLHLLVLAIPLRYSNVDPVNLAVAFHAPLLFIQLLLIAAAESTLFWQLVDVPRGLAWLTTLLAMLFHSLYAGAYLIAIPALAANMAKSLLGG